MLVILKVKTREGIAEHICQDFNDAGLRAADCIQAGETPLAVMVDGKQGFDQRATMRLAHEASY